MQYPDFNKTFTVTTDASNYAIGAVLSQNNNNKDLPIAYASRTLNEHEVNYSTTEKELLAIVWTVKYFRPYLYGRKFKIITDHRPLTWLMSLKDPSSKLVRWKIRLDEYDFDVTYKPGTLNSNADALSRIRKPFEIKYTNEDIFKTSKNIVHCVSKDLKFGKGFAQQVNERYNNRELFLKSKIDNKNILIQNIDRKKIFHLITKLNYYEKPKLKDIELSLKQLRSYCIGNDIFELNSPKICAGLDKHDFNDKLKLINKIFKETHITWIVHENPIPQNEVYINTSNESIVNNYDEQTVHSDEESDINGITYVDSAINVGKNQLIIKIGQEDKIDIKKMFIDKHG